ncbi:hypothetical protein FRC17_010753 [Serendipita sp. 399]|nr:hypothetical protein FRC17_010753 [Serendipita sp. 399]
MSMEREVSSRSVDNEKNEIARALVDGILMIVQSSPALNQFRGGLEDLRHTLSGGGTVEVLPDRIDEFVEDFDQRVEERASDPEASEKSITDGHDIDEVDVKSEMLVEEQQTVDVQTTAQYFSPPCRACARAHVRCRKPPGRGTNCLRCREKHAVCWPKPAFGRIPQDRAWVHWPPIPLGVVPNETRNENVPESPRHFRRDSPTNSDSEMNDVSQSLRDVDRQSSTRQTSEEIGAKEQTPIADSTQRYDPPCPACAQDNIPCIKQKKLTRKQCLQCHKRHRACWPQQTEARDEDKGEEDDASSLRSSVERVQSKKRHRFEDSDSEFHIPIAPVRKRRRLHQPETPLADSRLIDALTQAMTPLFEGLGREIAKLRTSLEMGYLQAGLGKPVGPFGQARSALFSAGPQQNDPDDSAINHNQ